MFKESCSKHEAIIKAQKLTGITDQQIPKPEHETGQDLSRAAVLTKMFSYFKNGLAGSKPAREYAASRNLDPAKIEMGYNSGQFHHGPRKDKYLIESCLKVGLLLDKGRHSIAGHKRASATETYKQTGLEQLKAIIDKLHPLQ